ncbi:MAG TPA: energy transducer TonB [Pyrinomonadaceae bacterium]|nr:energy transducer TonB [Pyrinomonadaceae bacterium]
MHSRRLHFVLASVLLTAFALAAEAQKPAEAWAEWETLSPEAEEFSVLMPKNPTTESTTFPYHKMELNARLYMATSSAGPVLAIASLSGIKSNPAQYTEFARFNSYVDAFKSFFPAKVRSKEAPVKITLVSSRPFHGHTGRAYKITIGDLSGSVNAFVTRKRFYAIVSLNNKKDEALEEKFLSSFVLPERQADPPKTIANANPDQPQNVNPPPPGEQGNTQNQSNQVQPEGETPLPATPANNAEPVPANAPNPAPNQGQNQGQQNQKRPPIAGGMLNGKAIYLPVPEVPPGEASGVVLVAILIDEQGTVVDARAVSGPQHLHQAAANAARLARFTPTLLMGEAVRVSGTLSYNFVRSN